jgi:hypothetical protein
MNAPGAEALLIEEKADAILDELDEVDTKDVNLLSMKK